MANKLDLESPAPDCETSPIHNIAFAQSYGALVAFHKGSEKISYASENIEELTGFSAQKLLNRRFTQVFEEKLTLFIMQAINNGKLISHRSVQLAKYKSVKGLDFIVIGHEHQGLVVLEFEPEDSVDGFDSPFEWLDSAEENLRSSENLAELLNETLNSLKDLLRYDRLMVYKFHEDGHGEVIAESREDELEAFYGMHFPAIDIPPVARSLFFKNWSRLVTNVHAPSVPIVTSEDTALDLTYTTLRAITPCHTEYLSNMGVDSTFVLPIINQGKLWGLLACHHYLPKFIGFHRRNTCQLLSRLLSLLIHKKEEEEKTAYLKSKEKLLDRIILNIHADHANFFPVLEKELLRILPEIDACGFSYYFNGQLRSIQQTPTDEVVIKLIEASPENSDDKASWVGKDLAANFNVDLEQLNGCFGSLCFRIPEMGEGYFIFFRSEYQHHIRWAGNPENRIETLNGHSRLTPNVSFELFLEEVKYQSKPWEERYILLIETFLAKLKDEIILYQGGELEIATSILSAVYDNSIDALFVTDLETARIIDCNQQALHFFEANSKQDLIGRSGQEFHANSLIEEEQEEKWQTLSSGESYSKEIQYITTNGKTKWGNYRAKPIDAQGKSLYVVRIIDITEKILVEQRLIEQNQELTKLNDELDRFVYSSSHDLRAPISSVLGLMDLVETMEDPRQILDLLSKGKKSLQRLDHFIQDILNYSRNTRLEIKCKEVNLFELVSNIVESYQYMHTENPVNMEVSIAPDHTILADDYRLKVILNNIISNAFKYRNPYITDSYVKVTSGIDEGTHCISIKDNGLGIQQQHLDKIFDMFHRADNNSSGSGLGLYIAHEMATKMGGTIEVQSAVNQGSTFYLRFPSERC